MKLAFVAAAMAFAAAGLSAHAQDVGVSGDVGAGRQMAMTTCSECHVVVPRQRSPRGAGGPPDFADIAAMPGMTKTALFVFLHTPHPTMPNLILSDRDSTNVIAYILSLEKQKSP